MAEIQSPWIYGEEVEPEGGEDYGRLEIWFNDAGVRMASFEEGRELAALHGELLEPGACGPDVWVPDDGGGIFYADEAHTIVLRMTRRLHAVSERLGCDVYEFKRIYPGQSGS
jgi:hypothetical protein